MGGYTEIGPEGVKARAESPSGPTRAEGAFIWVDLDHPDATELAATLDAVGLSRLGAEAAVAERRHPKVDFVSGAYLVVIKTLWYIEDTRQVETGDIVVYADDRSMVTVRRGSIDPVPAARERLAGDAGLRTSVPAAAVYALFGTVVEDYGKALEALSDDVDDIERDVFSAQRTDCIARIYSLIRETLEFQNAVQPLIPFAHQVTQQPGRVPEFSGVTFRDVAEDLLRIDRSVGTCMDLLTTVLSAHQGQIGSRQNEDMRRISAWAAIAVAPTAIAGIYGMNFEHMPELHWVFGYPLVLTVMAGVCLSLYRGFRRNGWL